MRKFPLACALVVLCYHSAFAHRHVVVAPNFAVGLGAGLAHMLGSMQPHPQGCPRTAFCGCGVADRVFGEPRRDLWPAAAWYRFRRASFAPGNVIVRPHHVKYIESVTGAGVGLCYDPNSGHHLTRIDACRASDGVIVDPRG